MTRHQAGRYAAKHPQGTQVPTAVAEAVTAHLKNNGISCKLAHDMAQSLGVPAATVGIAIDLQEARIRACQLGLFGHSPGPPPASQARKIPQNLIETIEAVRTENRLTCAEAWQIAQTHSVSRLMVGQACESLGIKIHKCQLGAF